MTRAAIFVVAALLTAPEALAQTTWYVDDDTCPAVGDGSAGNPYCSIQLAIIVASIGDEIVVHPGTYFESIDFFSKALTVRSMDPNDPAVVMSTVIDGSGSDHVVQCVSGEGPDSVLSGFVITGGNANGGGDDDNGGGMYNDGSSPTVSNCSFIGNTATLYGGGMCNINGSAPTVSNCRFSGNTAQLGGGMGNAVSTPTVVDCVFNVNTATDLGGGMFNGGSNASVTGCTFAANSATGGGGMQNNLSSPAIVNCDFTYNSAINAGGGIANGSDSPLDTLTISNCLFDGNYALVGGGIFNDSADPEVSNTGFCGNSPEAINGTYTDGSGNSLTFCAPPFAAAESCPADTNNDGMVDVVDLLNVLGSWGVCPG